MDDGLEAASGIYSVLIIHTPSLEQNATVSQLSWLERYTDNVEVPSSTLGGTTKTKDNDGLRMMNAE